MQLCMHSYGSFQLEFFLAETHGANVRLFNFHGFFLVVFVYVMRQKFVKSECFSAVLASFNQVGLRMAPFQMFLELIVVDKWQCTSLTIHHLVFVKLRHMLYELEKTGKGRGAMLTFVFQDGDRFASVIVGRIHVGDLHVAFQMSSIVKLYLAVWTWKIALAIIMDE